MKIDGAPKYNFEDVLIRPRKSVLNSRADVNLERAFAFSGSASWAGFPLIAANMDTVGTFAMARALLSEQALVSLHKFYGEKELIEFFNSSCAKNSFYTLGISNDDMEKLKTVSSAVEVTKISIDVANGYIGKFVEAAKAIRESHRNAILMAGTVVTAEMTVELLHAGVDIVRIGIGSGSVCKTRDVTGVGVPQLSAIAECADAAHDFGGYICADGGCKSSGDIAKALGAGADFVMTGSMLAGHDECEGDWIFEPGSNGPRKKAHIFYGMASDKAMLKHYGEIASYRPIEGAETEIPYRGAAIDTIRAIKNGLRSTMTYINARSIDEIPSCVTFVRSGS